MAYRIPTFNIVCNITQPDAVGVPGVPTSPVRLANVACQLTWGRRVQEGRNSEYLPAFSGMSISLLVAAGTDIRGPQDTVSFDMVECPAGTGRWYYVVAVDDIGRGFANEHRCGMMVALDASWVAPYP